jgi:hypothetical protein
VSTRPDADVAALAARARAEWAALADAYDAIEERLTHATWHDLGDLAEQLGLHERELAAITAAVTAAGPGAGAHVPALAALRADARRMARRLAERLPALLRTATAARDALAARLARARTGRNQTEHYRGAGAPAPRFTSRVV